MSEKTIQTKKRELYAVVLAGSPIAHPVVSSEPLQDMWVAWLERRRGLLGWFRRNDPFVIKDERGAVIAAFFPGTVIGIISNGEPNNG